VREFADQQHRGRVVLEQPLEARALVMVVVVAGRQITVTIDRLGRDAQRDLGVDGQIQCAFRQYFAVIAEFDFPVPA